MSNNKGQRDGESVWKDVGWFALKTTAISGAVLGAAAVAIPAIGFTSGGVAAGSLAAAYQSAFLGGTIASGSAFAVLQSVGAAGLAAGTQGAIVAASAAAAGAHTIAKKIKKNTGTDSVYTLKELDHINMEECEEEEELAENYDKEVKADFGVSEDMEKLMKKLLSKRKKDGAVNYVMHENKCEGLMRETKGNDVFDVHPKKIKDDTNTLDSVAAQWKKWRDIELSNDLMLSHQLIKKI